MLLTPRVPHKKAACPARDRRLFSQGADQTVISALTLLIAFFSS